MEDMVIAILMVTILTIMDITATGIMVIMVQGMDRVIGDELTGQGGRIIFSRV
jgi:hypothetical protein